MVAEADVGEGPPDRGPQGRAVLPALRHRAVVARGRAGLQGRRRPVGVRALPAEGRAGRRRCSAGPRRRGRCCRTRRSPWTRMSHTCARARATRCSIVAEALVERVLGEGAEVDGDASGRRAGGHRATSRRSPTSPTTGQRGHTVLAGRLRHHRGRHRRRPHRASRSARTTSGSARSTGSRSRTRCSPDGTFDERIEAVRRPLRQGGGPPTSSRRSRERGRLFRAEEYEHAYPHCWRCDTPLIYYAKTSWYVRTTEVKDELLARERVDQLVPGAHQARPLRQLAREQRGLGALARALLGHAAAGLALWRRGRTWSASARSPRSRERGGDAARGRAPPLHRRGGAHAARSAAARCAACRT